MLTSLLASTAVNSLSSPIPLPITQPYRYIGDTKAGTLIGTDRFGNKYYENLAEELPLRTRWVDYTNHEFDASHIEPGWHAWISYMVDKPPPEDNLLKLGVRSWELVTPRPNMTLSRGAYRPYST
jgi:NADH:ubiquinone oxidoreductase subunit